MFRARCARRRGYSKLWTSFHVTFDDGTQNDKLGFEIMESHCERPAGAVSEERMVAMKFRKKPVVIEAFQLTANPDEQASIEAWCSGAIKGVRLPPEARCLDIQTLEGEMRANVGDWIIKGVKGEFYSCKPDIFEATYEAV